MYCSLIRTNFVGKKRVRINEIWLYLVQLRVNLSPLRSHKKHHNFADTPSDICACNQGIEDTRHFLFECLRFATHRASLAVTVTDVLHRNNLIGLVNNLELYLYVIEMRHLEIRKCFVILVITLRESSKRRDLIMLKQLAALLHLSVLDLVTSGGFATTFLTGEVYHASSF